MKYQSHGHGPWSKANNIIVKNEKWIEGICGKCQKVYRVVGLVFSTYYIRQQNGGRLHAERPCTQDVTHKTVYFQ